MRRLLPRPGRLRALLLLLVFAASAAAPLAVPVAAAATQAVASVVAAPTPGTDCLQPPMPESPTDGLAAWIDPGPTTLVEGDPFAPDSRATIYDAYGYNGFHAVRYDPGCGWSWDPNNEMANGITNLNSTLTATGVRLTRLVMSGGFGSLWDPVQNEAARILGNGLFLPLIAVALTITAIYFMASAKDADPAKAATESMGTAVVIALGMAAATYTLTVGATIDRGITGAFAAANQLVTSNVAGGERDASDAVAANLLTQIQYNTWRIQTFGSDEAAAAKYGPDLFKAGAISRTEQAGLMVLNDADKEAYKREATDEARKDPNSIASSALAEKNATRKVDEQPGVVLGSKAKALTDKKQADYKRIASEIERDYPQAYYHLKGGDTQARAGHSMAALGATLASVGFLLYCLGWTLWAMVVVRIGIGMIPAIALLAQHPSQHHLAVELFTWIVEAVGKAVVFGFAFVVFLAGGIGGIMAPQTDWHPLAKTIAMVMLSVAMWKLGQRLGVTGGGRWRLRKMKKDRHQYGRRWDKEARPERGGTPRQTPVQPVFSEQTALGAGRPPMASIGAGPGVTGTRGRRVPGMGHVYGEGARPHAGQARMPGIGDGTRPVGNLGHLGKLAGAASNVVPGGAAGKAMAAAVRAAALPRGATGALALPPGPTRSARPPQGVATFRKPLEGVVVDRAHLHRPVPGVGSRVSGRYNKAPNPARPTPATRKD